MMDSIQATGTPASVTLAGVEYPIRQLSHAEWAPLQAWLKRAVPSPLVEATRAIRELEQSGELTESARSMLLANAHHEARLWPPRAGSSHWFDALGAVEGGAAQVVRAILAAGGTPVPLDEAGRIFEAASVEEIGAMWAQALHGDTPGPKATAGTTGPTPAPSPTSGA